MEADRLRRNELAARFEEVAQLLASLDVERIWTEATDVERRILIDDLISAVDVFPHHLVVNVFGAPPLNLTLAKVGLRERGTRTSVSEGRIGQFVHAVITAELDLAA